jgi:hypothetical protein
MVSAHQRPQYDKNRLGPKQNWVSAGYNLGEELQILCSLIESREHEICPGIDCLSNARVGPSINTGKSENRHQLFEVRVGIEFPMKLTARPMAVSIPRRNCGID